MEFHFTDFIIIREKREPWSQERMMRIAKANDNGGVYYEAKSARTPRDLERLFRQREVAGLLEETIGGILGGQQLSKRGRLLVQVRRDAVHNPRTLDNVKMCLEDLKVTLIQPVPVHRSF